MKNKAVWTIFFLWTVSNILAFMAFDALGSLVSNLLWICGLIFYIFVYEPTKK